MTATPSAIHYEYDYSYNPETMLTRTGTLVDPSPLNLLSHAVSSVATEPTPRVLGNPVTLPDYRLPPPGHVPPVVIPPATIPMSPETSSAIPKRRSSPPNASSPPSVLAVFPQFPPFKHSIPMPPGMEITLEHPDSSSNETKAKDPKMRDSKAALGKQSPTKARGKSKYKMKYHYISMRRWEAYRYIDELARGYASPPQPQQHHAWTIGAVPMPSVRVPSVVTRLPPIPTMVHPPVASSVVTKE